MTDSEKQRIKQFEARVRQLILQYKTLQSTNKELTEKLRQSEDVIKDLESELAQARHDYNTLKTAKMIEISDGDLKNAKQTITQLVREVNKCIGLLSTEQVTQSNK
ncbi:MAG: hypothetical protein J5805_08055 [Bacteroidaceae bacterium]|nr:hypothetical protein [Bacteroidaceae bacterium]